MRSELRKRGRRDEQKRSWSLLGRSDGGKRSELSWRRGERERGTDTKRGRTERRREAVTIYVKRRGKETDEKNDDGSPHSLLIVRRRLWRWPHHSLPPPTERESRSGSPSPCPPSLDDCGAGFIIDEHFIDSSKARRSLDLFAVAKII